LLIVNLANGAQLDLATSSKIVLDSEVLGVAAALAAPAVMVEQIQRTIARGEDPAAIGAGNNGLSVLALRGNVLGPETRADSVVASANMMAVTAEGYRYSWPSWNIASRSFWRLRLCAKYLEFHIRDWRTLSL
jgi:hypothetical protein